MKALALTDGYGIDALRTIERERIETTHMAPVMVQAVLDHPDLKKHDVSSLDRICYSAAPMPVTAWSRQPTRSRASPGRRQRICPVVPIWRHTQHSANSQSD